MSMSREQMRAWMDQYLATVDNNVDHEWYCTDYGRESVALTNFFEFLYKDDIQKEKRYAQYLELKAEFETNKGEKK